MSSRSASIQDYDSITLRTIRAVNAPAYTSLTSDGLGGTYWSTLSSPMAYVSAFKGICTPARLYVADASYNIMRFNAGQGIEFIPTGKYSTTVVAHAFNELAVPSLSNISSGDSRYGLSISTLIFSSLGNTLFTTDPRTNSLTYEIRYPTFRIQDTILRVNDQLSSITFVGQGDVLMSTGSNYFVGFQMSTFTSTGYSALFTTISTISTGTISTISSLYAYKKSLAIVSSIFIQNELFSTLSTIRNLAISTTLLSTQIEYSTLYSRYYRNISSYVSSFSTALHYEMIYKPSTFIEKTFGSYTLISNGTTLRNLVYDINDMSTVMSSFIAPLISSVQYNIPSTFYGVSTLIGGLTLSTFSTLSNLSSYSLSLGGIQFSSFSTTIMNTFQNVSSSKNRQDYRFFPSYVVNKGLQTTNGIQHDIYLSTCEISLSSFYKYIDNNSRLFIDYTPSYAFKSLSLSHVSSISTPDTSAYIVSSVFTNNTYPVCTFITHYDTLLPESVFSDVMAFNMMNLPNTYTYQEIYNRTMRLQISPQWLSYQDPSPYVIHHYHSSIVNLNNIDLFVNDPQTNMYGGIVVPTTFKRDCDLNITTTVQWSNSMNTSTAVSLYINNGLPQ